MQEVGDEDGFEDVEFKVALAAGEGDGGLVAEDLRAEHGEGFALRGVDFARHDGGAGFVLGEFEFGEAAAGAGAEEADVLGDFEERGCERVEGAVCFDDGVVGCKSFEFVGRGLEFVAGEGGDFGGDGFGEAGEGVEAGADGCAALGEQAEAGEGGGEAEQTVVELVDVGGEFLAEGERGCVLEVGAADFDDVVELGAFGVEGVAEALEGGDELFFEF